ncbi:MAG: RagB/SusD family nutrient uptake outer membrane protein [Thermoflexibacter sp.]
MKNTKVKLIFTFVLLLGVTYACKDSFLDQPPIGTFSANVLQNKAGAEGMLIGAYSMLDGIGGPSGWQSAGSNWVYGSICGNDAYKGTDAGDQADINSIERFEPLPNNGYFIVVWRHLYDAIGRSNDAIRFANEAKDMSQADKTRLIAEARFLRGHYHFELRKIFNRAPYIDETVTDYLLPNDKEIFPNIEADFKFAFDNLPETLADAGRANKWAAGAFLGKAYMFQKKYTEAKQIFDQVIANGRTTRGARYALNASFHDNFRAATKNSAESVFAVQYSVNDGANGNNGDAGGVLNYPYNNGPGGCCGFFQPTQNLVNAYQVDANGLPLLETFNNTDVKNDQGIASNQPFEPHTGPLDPRLDWTVGRRGIPYLDWGPHGGQNWIRDQAYGGPYSPKKNVYYKAEEGRLSDATGWTRGYSANNYTIMRYADVLLMAAEAEAEVGSLAKALDYVNQVRRRAANPAGFVKNPDGSNAANYKIGEYSSFPSKEFAIRAIRFERRLELAMEGHRFFDLVRWGIAAENINEYFRVEQTKRQYLRGARFTAGKNEYFPIPEQAIVRSLKDGQPTLKQNPGY